MIDTDYNEESFFVRHCYFTGGNDPYKRLKTALKADIDADAWDVALPDRFAAVREARDRQDRGQGHQRLRRRSHEGLRGELMRPRAGRVGLLWVLDEMTAYTEAQAEAIACLDEPLQIIACAGSGKTQVISQRIAAILAQPGVEPRNVVAFTFTEKAAAELKERILSIVETRTRRRLGLAEMYVGTMHGYALDLLQRLVPETFKFSVLTDITARLLIDRNSRKSGLTACPTSSSGHARPAALPALAALHAGD